MALKCVAKTAPVLLMAAMLNIVIAWIASIASFPPSPKHIVCTSYGLSIYGDCFERTGSSIAIWPSFQAKHNDKVVMTPADHWMHLHDHSEFRGGMAQVSGWPLRCLRWEYSKGSMKGGLHDSVQSLGDVLASWMQKPIPPSTQMPANGDFIKGYMSPESLASLADPQRTVAKGFAPSGKTYSPGFSTRYANGDTQTFSNVPSWTLPCQPMWSGLVFNSVAYTIIVWILLRVFRMPIVLRAYIRRSRGLCPVCGYPKSNSTNATCPECGQYLQAI